VVFTLHPAATGERGSGPDSFVFPAAPGLNEFSVNKTLGQDSPVADLLECSSNNP